MNIVNVLRKNTFVIKMFVAEAITCLLFLYLTCNTDFLSGNNVKDVYTNVLGFKASLVIGSFLTLVLGYLGSYRHAVIQAVIISTVNFFVAIILPLFLGYDQSLIVSIILSIYSIACCLYFLSRAGLQERSL